MKKEGNNRKPILLCGGSQGRAVIFGWVDEYPEQGKQATLHDARMVLYWDGSAGLFGLAAKGPQGKSCITASVDVVSDIDWKQYLAVSDSAVKVFDGWPDE